MISKLLFFLKKKDKINLVFLIIFSIIISLIEVIGISAIMPFISVSSDLNLIQSNEYYRYIYNTFSFENDINFIIVFACFLIVFYLLRSGVNIMYLYLLSRFTQGRYHYISYKLFNRYMSIPYQAFVSKNSAEMTKMIITEALLLSGLISALLLMMSEIFIILLIYILMIIVNWKITLALTIVLAFNAFLMIKTVTKRIKLLGRQRVNIQSRFYEAMNRSFGNFKFIKLSVSGVGIVQEFHQISFDASRLAIKNFTFSSIPRLFLEGVGFSIVVAIIAFLIWDSNGNITTVMATVSIFVLSLYRLLPSVNKIMTNYNTIQYNNRSLELVHDDITEDVEALGEDNINFRNIIKLENMDFSYETDRLLFKNINIAITKGSKVGFIGGSGSGKTTLVDILIGMYIPTSGNLLIDNTKVGSNNLKSWRAHIGYIPQSVYLFDGTVAENIVFGREYNKEKIIEVLKQSNIYDFLFNKEGLDTIVGEGGIMLSGGQKQRIAIARALYGDPDVLVLDEATSALDDDTERNIMNEIYKVSQDKTLLIIAHRLGTLDKCDYIFKLDNGKITKIDNAK
jgi:ATP-binding cassette, subfamily B, bacterial PglK